MPGTSPTGSAPVSASRSAAALSCGSGQISRNKGVVKAAEVADTRMSTSMIATARPARRPALAASAVAAMPTITSETTRGTMVMRSAFSHAPPIGSATDTASSTQPAPEAPLATPAMRPRRRASRMRAGCDMRRV